MCGEDAGDRGQRGSLRRECDSERPLCLPPAVLLAVWAPRVSGTLTVRVELRSHPLPWHGESSGHPCSQRAWDLAACLGRSYLWTQFQEGWLAPRMMNWSRQLNWFDSQFIDLFLSAVGGMIKDLSTPARQPGRALAG